MPKKAKMTHEEQMAYIINWSKENQDRIEVRVRKGTKDSWKTYCDQLGESMSSLVSKAVEEYVEKRLPQ